MWSIRFVMQLYFLTTVESATAAFSCGSWTVALRQVIPCGRCGNARCHIVDCQLQIMWKFHFTESKSFLLFCLVGWLVDTCCDDLSETGNIFKNACKLYIFFRWLFSLFRFVTLVRATQEAEFWSTEWNKNKGTYNQMSKPSNYSMPWFVSEIVLFFCREGWLSFEDLFQTASADFQVSLIRLSSGKDTILA